MSLYLYRLRLCECERNKGKDAEVPEETSDQPTVKQYNISYALCCHTKSKTRVPEICCSHFPLSFQSSFFFPSPLLEEINLAPLLKPARFLWPFLSVLFQKGKALQPEQFALQSHARGDAWLSCFITGGLG